MDLEFTDDQEELRRSAREFLGAESPVALVRQVVESGRSADKLWQAMVELDWLSFAVPQDCGGLGMGAAELAVLCEELGRVIAPVPFLPTVTQYVAVVRELGADDQREALLGEVAGEGRTGALALADHPARWRVGELTAQAEQRRGRWLLRGQKHGVMAGPDVDRVAVAARVQGAGGATGGGGDPLAGVAVFVVPGSELAIRPLSTLDASRPLAQVDLDGVVVPPEGVLGSPGACGPGLLRAVEEATLGLALETVGVCDALFELTHRYTLDRHQFGVPIGSFQAIKHKMADLLVSLSRARALAYYAVASVAEDHPERHVAVSMAKAAADDCQRQVCQEAIQTLGGIGFTWEHDAHLYVKRAKTNGALFGSGAEHRMAVAAHLGLAGSL